MSVRGYTVGIDFSGAGDFTGPYDDVTSKILDVTFEVSWGRDTSRAVGPMVAGTLGFSLDNGDRRYSTSNSASPIAGQVTAGIKARLTYNNVILLDGVVAKVTVDPDAPAKDATFEILDAWGRPGAEKITTGLSQGVRTGDAIGLVLDAIGWPADRRDLDPGATFIPWWWVEDQDAATAITDLVDSEGPPAIAFVQGGVFVFRDRHHRITDARSMTSQATFTGLLTSAGPGGAFKLLQERTYDDGLDYVANSAAFAVEQRGVGLPSVVWTSDDPISLGVNDTVVVQAQAADPFYGGEVVADTDGTVVAVLSRTSGRSTLITLTTGGAAAIVNSLSVTGTSVPVLRTVKASAEDAASVAARERVAWPGEVPWAGPYDAQAIATRIVSVYAQPRPAVTVSIADLDATYEAQITARQVGDRITIRDDDLGINGDYVIEQLTHKVTKLGVAHTVTFGCQVVDPTQPVNVFTFDVAGKGFNDGAFGVAGIDSPTGVFRFDTAGQGFNQGAFAS